MTEEIMANTITDRDLFWPVIDAAERFATQSVIAAAEAGLDLLSGVFVVLLDIEALRFALVVGGITIAMKDADLALGPDVAALVQRGLSQMTDDGQQRTAALLTGERAQLVLLVPLGQIRASIHGVIVDRTDLRVQAELFVLTTETREETVH
jgi:hypothetical protein